METKKYGEFTVKSCYELLMGENDTRMECFPVKQIWKAQALPRIAFFAYEASRECILTIDNLMKRGRVMVNGCYLCKQVAETRNHVLLWCPTSYNLWSMVYGLLEIS